MSAAGGLPDVDTMKREISDEISRIHLESYGEAVSNVTVSLAEEAVVVVMDVDLSRAEQTLVEAGMSDSVRVSRETYQEAVGANFIAVVERATGRRVTGFASRTVMDRVPWSAEIFRLRPTHADA